MCTFVALFAVKMEILKRYTLPFKGLKIGVHQFDFEVDGALFQAFESDEVKRGAAKVSVQVTKAASMLTLDVQIRGEVVVECDRCLDDCNLPIEFDDQIQVKFSEEEIDFDGEVLWLNPSESEVELGRYIYDSIMLSLPYSRVHAEGDCNPEMLARFTTVSEEEFEQIAEAAERDEELDEINREQWAKLAALKAKMENEQ